MYSLKVGSLFRPIVLNGFSWRSIKQLPHMYVTLCGSTTDRLSTQSKNEVAYAW